eukprot:237942-Pleurochrysis_carterae.AAC.1
MQLSSSYDAYSTCAMRINTRAVHACAMRARVMSVCDVRCANAIACTCDAGTVCDTCTCCARPCPCADVCTAGNAYNVPYVTILVRCIMHVRSCG